MAFSRQENCSGLPFPSSGDLPNPGIEPRSPSLQADALTSEPPGKLVELGLKRLAACRKPDCNGRKADTWRRRKEKTDSACYASNLLLAPHSPDQCIASLLSLS